MVSYGNWFSRYLIFIISIYKQSILVEFKMSNVLLPVQYWIDNLKLVEHPGDEEGFFREAFWDKSILVDVNSPDGDKRCIASIAYFLQEKDKRVNDETMFFQCLQSNEMLFYHYGHPLSIYILEMIAEHSNLIIFKILNYAPSSSQEKEDGTKELKKAATLGNRIHAGECFSYVVPKGCWFTRLVEESDVGKTDDKTPSYTVYSCSLVPGFDIRDFRSKKYKDFDGIM